MVGQGGRGGADLLDISAGPIWLSSSVRADDRHRVRAGHVGVHVADVSGCSPGRKASLGLLDHDPAHEVTRVVVEGRLDDAPVLAPYVSPFAEQDPVADHDAHPPPRSDLRGSRGAS